MEQLPKLQKKLERTAKRHDVLKLIFGEQQEELDKLREQTGWTPPEDNSTADKNAPPTSI